MSEIWAGDVIVVGAGPAGLAVTNVLTRAGCRVRLVDRRSEPQNSISAGLLTSAFSKWSIQNLDLAREDLSTILDYQGTQLHLPGRRIITLERPCNAVWVRRENFLTALRDRCEHQLYVGTVRKLQLGEETCRVIVQRGKREVSLKAPIVIDASGQRADGLPKQGQISRWDGRSEGVTYFEAEVLLEAVGYRAGWSHMVVAKHFLATVQALPHGLAVRAIVKSDETWRDRWIDLVTYLNSTMRIELRREAFADFHWVHRRNVIELGHDRFLRVGQAAGLGTLLGFGFDYSVRSGVAAANAYLKNPKSPKLLYQQSLAPILTLLEKEGTLTGTAEGFTQLDQSGVTINKFTENLGMWRRWRLRRHIAKVINSIMTTPARRRPIR